MKISNETIAILKNFSTINQNILFRVGSTIATMSPTKSIFAKATVNEKFPIEFGIYDLNNFLSLLTFMENQDIEFKEKSLTISNNNGTFEYYYSPQNILTVAPNKTLEFSTVFQFELQEKDIIALNKSIAILSANSIRIESDENGDVLLFVGDNQSHSNANHYRKQIGKSNASFSCYFDVSNFLVMQDSYTVSLSNRLVHFKAQKRNLEYFIALDPSSKI